MQLARLGRIVPLFLLAFAAACGGGDGPTQVVDTKTITISGRAERGSIIHVAITSGSTSTPVTAGITLTPADAGVVQANGDIMLTKAGPITIATSGVSLAVNIAVPPTIVFDGLASGNRDVYRIAIDGQDLKRLTTNTADDSHPSSSANVVVFNTYRDTNSEVYSIPVDGGTERRLSTTATRNELQPMLSPDGKKIVFTTNQSGLSKVWIANVDAVAGVTGAAALSTVAFGGGTVIEGTPSWAPGSDKIALMTTGTPSGTAGLFTAAATANTTPTLVTGSGTQVVEVEPSWSFDGNFLAFAAVTGNATEIYTRDLRTNATVKLTSLGSSSGQPAWLPDGRIVFTTFAGGTPSLRWIDPATPADIHIIATPGLTSEHAAPVRP